MRKRRPHRTELARIMIVGLALAIGLAIAGIFSASAGRSPGRGPYPATDMVSASARPSGPHR